jgi:large subunit ribosomal protein L15
MKLHELKSIKSRVHRRIGRGGKRGTTSGRGTKGQHSRSGRRQRPAERDLIMRLPKLRGFRNKPKSDTVKVFNLDELSKKLKPLAKTGPLEVTIDVLKTAGILGKKFKGEIKILATGEIEFPITLKGLKVSKSALEKIDKTSKK